MPVVPEPDAFVDKHDPEDDEDQRFAHIAKTLQEQMAHCSLPDHLDDVVD